MEEIAVVTGASSGIGAATARALAKSGYRVIAAARRVDLLESLATYSNLITPFELDVTKQESVDKLQKELTGKPVAILINNAGGAFDAESVLESDPQIWSKTYEVNVVGAVRVTKAIAPIMKFHGRGHIVIISSTAGYIAYENGGSYVAAKHGDVALARTLRLELAGDPIRVTEIAPGMVKTDEFAKNRFGGDKEKAEKIYQGVDKPLTAEDVAEAIRWSVTLPDHFNIDTMVIRPIAQAAQHKVIRKS